MIPFDALLLVAAPLWLLLLGAVPSRWANRSPRLMGAAAQFLAIASFGVAVGMAARVAKFGMLHCDLLALSSPIPLGVGVYFDPLAATMMVLISFIGMIIVRYSVRYLDGEATQGRFLRWMSFTLGAVLSLILSSNLVMFTAAWIVTSFGLHQLLTHYHERPAAILAARKKFLVSRLGDILLITALALTYFSLGSFEYATLFAAAQSISEGNGSPSWTMSLIGTLFVLGAMTKSAQFPLHSWLPDTLDAPTPVSALMHAGIINAGGFLVLRLSPVISLSQLALDFLAVVGAVTALVGGTVMLTQTSIKRYLAYSTVAQMGFMMLQCGLGAFTAAMLHIVAHSLYKTHAFLSSGAVLDAPVVSKRSTAANRLSGGWTLLLAGSLAAAIAWISSTLLEDTAKPGGLVLSVIMAIAFTQLLWNAFATGKILVALAGFCCACGLALSYRGAWSLFDLVLSDSIAHSIDQRSVVEIAIATAVVIGFAGLLGAQLLSSRAADLPLARALYVHAYNGFYCEFLLRRIVE